MIHCERHDDVAVVTIDRPERRNAPDPPTATALVETGRRIDAVEAERIGSSIGWSPPEQRSTRRFNSRAGWPHSPKLDCDTTGSRFSSSGPSTRRPRSPTRPATLRPSSPPDPSILEMR
jgi:hypothetical protein